MFFDQVRPGRGGKALSSRGGHRPGARLAAPVPISRSDAGRLFRCKPTTSAQTAAPGTNPPLRCGLSSPLQTSCYRTNHPLRYAPAAPLQADHFDSSPAPVFGSVSPSFSVISPPVCCPFSEPSIFRRSRPFPRSFLPLSYRAAQYLAIPLADSRAACRITPRSLSNYFAQSVKSSSPPAQAFAPGSKSSLLRFLSRKRKKSSQKAANTPKKHKKPPPGLTGRGRQNYGEFSQGQVTRQAGTYAAAEARYPPRRTLCSSHTLGVISRTLAGAHWYLRRPAAPGRLPHPQTAGGQAAGQGTR